MVVFPGQHLDEAEGRELLEELLEAACLPPRVCRWSVGDLVMWDNPFDPAAGHVKGFGWRATEGTRNYLPAVKRGQ